MAKQTLLQKAKQYNVTNNVNRSAEDIELALAWVKGEVRFTQVAEVYGGSASTTYSRLAISLKQYLNSKK